MSNQALQTVTSLLSSRGHEVWLVGAAARARVAGEEPRGVVQLVTSAGESECADVAESAAAVGVADIEPLCGRSLEAVLRERGITADAIAIAAADGAIVDPFGGVPHLETRALRTIASPDAAFRQQPALLLRVGRIVASTGFEPSSELRRFAQRDAGNILDIEDRGAVWGQEMNGLLLGTHISAGLQWLQDVRVLQLVFPEIAAMVGFDKSCTVHHKDIWDHTKQVTQKATDDLVVRWAALCHDIGKIWTRSVNRQGKVHFFRHEEHGALLFESIAHRCRLSADLTHRVAYLIENHSRVNLYRNDWTDSAVRRLIKQTDGHLHDLLAFSKADYTTKRESRIREMKRTMAELEARIERIREEDARVPPLSKGVGNALMQRFGMRPSRAIGDLKRMLEDAIEAGALPERAEDEVYIGWLASHPPAVERIESAGGAIA